MTAASSDAESGVSYTFPTLPAGWSASGTGAARTYSYTASPTAPSGNQNVTAINGSGLTASTAMTFTADSTAPAGQTVALFGGPYYTALSIPLTIDWGSDAGSGLNVATETVERRSATLSSGVCGAYGSWAAVTLTAGADTTVANAKCYEYRIKVTDNVGNVSAYSATSVDAYTDTSAPTATVALAESSPYTSVTSTTLYYNAQSSNSGTFTVTVTPTDAQSGIQKVTFPAVTGMTGGGDVASTPYQTNYSWTASTTSSGAQTTTTYNNAGLTVTKTFTTTKDITKPTGQTVALSGGPFYSTLSVPLTIGNGTDAGSGLDTSSLVVERDSIAMTNGVCGTYPGNWAAVTLDTGADTTVTTGNCYRYRVKISDNVGNTSNYSTVSGSAMVDSTAPAAPSITAPTAVTGAASQYYDSGTSTLYFQPAATGSFQLNATAADAESGIASVAFPDLSGVSGFTGGSNTATTSPYNSTTYAWSSGASTPGAQTISATNNAGLASGNATIAISGDSIAPTGQSVALSGGPWYAAASVPLTIGWGSDAGSGLDSSSQVVERDSATLSNGSCDSFSGSWSTVTLVGGADTTVTSGNCYRYRIRISDNVGNTSANSTATADAKVDTTAPSAPALTLSESSALSYVSGTTLYYNAQGSNTASFTVDGTSTDAQSGIQKLNFPSITGMTGGGDDSSSPYQGSYTWTNTTTASGAQTVTSYNGASSTATATFTVTKDITAPTGQSVSLTAGPWYTAASVALTLDWGTDGGSGLDTSTQTVERDSATLSNGSCGSFSGSWSAVTLTAGADTTVTSGNCYRYRIRVSDNVGNTSANSTATADAKIDTTAPSAPGLTLNESSALSYVSGSTLYYNAQGSNTASFTVDGTSTDAQSGIQKLNFPSVSGMTGGGDDTSSPYQGSYTWTNTTSASGAQTVTSTNGAGTTAIATFTVTKDTTAPTGQSATLSGGPWYTSASVPLTLDNGSDGGSGLDTTSGLVERATATLTAGTCGSFGSWSTVTLTGGADTTVTSGNCYRYRYTISDNVGNQSSPSSASADAKVDTSAPSAPALSISESSPLSYVSGTTLYYNAQGSNTASFTVDGTSADAQSGIQKLTFPTVSGMTGGGDDSSSPYQGSYTWTNTTTASGTQTVTATNGAGTTATATFTVTKDITAPTGQTSTLAGGPWYTTLSVPLTLGWGSDAGSGLDNTTQVVERDTAALSGGSCGAFSGTWSTVTLVGGADTTVVSGNCYRYRISVSDNVGNTSSNSTATADAKVDTSAPTVAATAPTAVTGTANQYYSSGTLWFRPTGSGSFALNATASDAQSGVQVSFPNVSGTTGWTGSTGGTDTTSPYSSPADYTWTTGATQLGSTTITATNGAGLSAADSLTISADTTAPTGQSATLTAGPWYTTLSVGVTLDNGTDAESGIDTSSAVVERSSATLTSGTCGTFGSWSTVTLTGGADTTVTSGNCYRYRYTISDNVGNTSSPSTATADAKIDTTAPSAPALTLSESSALSYVSGTTLYYNAQGSNTASFTVDGTSTDAQSGIQKLNFPSVPGMTGGGDDVSSPYQGSYTWTNTTSASGSQTVTASNSAGTTATSTFSVTKDVTAPTGQTADLSGGPWYTSLSVPLTLGNGSDSGSGIDATSQIIERDSATLSGGSCGSFSGSWSSVTLSGGADTTVVSGNCYRYRLKISDNVANQATTSASADAKVDTSAPSAPALTLSESSALSYVSGTTLYYNAQGSNTASFTVDGTSTDAQSGIQKLTFPTVSGMTGGGDDSSSPTRAPTPGRTPRRRRAPRPSPPPTGPARPQPRPSPSPKTSPPRPGRPATSPAAPGTPPSPSPHTRLGLGRRLRPRQHHPSRRTRHRHPRRRQLRNVQRLLVDGHTGRRRRHHRHQRQLLPLPHPHQRQRRQHQQQLIEHRRRKSRHNHPERPGLTLNESSPLSYVSGTTLYYNAQGSNTASFTVDGTSTDAQSGIQKLNFPSISGMTGGGDDSSSPYQGSYTWTNTTTATGAQTVTATNGAGSTATATFTVTKDTTAPTGQTVSLVGGPSYTDPSVPLTLDNGSDSGAGVHASTGVVERDEAPLVSGSCGSFSGSWTPITLTGGADTTVQPGNCYRYRYTITDNVGNASAPSSASADAMVGDATPPNVSATAPTPVTGTGNQSYEPGTKTLWFRPTGTGSFTLGATARDPGVRDLSGRFPRPLGCLRLVGNGRRRHLEPVLLDGVQLVGRGERSGSTDRDGHQRCESHRHRHDHDRRRLDRPQRRLGCPLGWPLVLDAQRSAGSRQRLRLPVGRRFFEPHRRA